MCGIHGISDISCRHHDSLGGRNRRSSQNIGLLWGSLLCCRRQFRDKLARNTHKFTALRSRLVGQRASDEPHRFTSVTLHFTVEGAVPAEAVERAIQLSRDKYCSVWHSMRNDIDLQVTFELVP